MVSLFIDAFSPNEYSQTTSTVFGFTVSESSKEIDEFFTNENETIGPAGAPVGFCIVKGDELYQLWLAPQARGTGAAAALMADAEAHFSRAGVRTAWLACAIGNDRGVRFYEKAGWQNVGVVTYAAETSVGPIQLEVFRFERRVT